MTIVFEPSCAMAYLPFSSVPAISPATTFLTLQTTAISRLPGYKVLVPVSTRRLSPRLRARSPLPQRRVSRAALVQYPPRFLYCVKGAINIALGEKPAYKYD